MCINIKKPGVFLSFEHLAIDKKTVYDINKLEIFIQRILRRLVIDDRAEESSIVLLINRSADIFVYTLPYIENVVEILS